ncbi:MAG: diguanylate cyclase [Acidobacteria bacterium]|nr:MAG: diguanylate cyclase [Acidobacteriota bacterium]REK09654.1 MAG: diguanylate cyclase [Acidobacteriota bacterium]
MTRSAIRAELLRAVADALPEPIFVLDEDGRYVAVIGGSLREKYDDPSALLGRTLREVLPAPRAAEFLERIRACLAEERTVLHDYLLDSDEVHDEQATGGPRGAQYFEGSVVPLGVVENERRLVAWIAYNATERHQLLERLEEQRALLERQGSLLEHQAMTDDLTGLANRRRFMALLEREFGDRSALALITLDVDHFKRINDRRGHAAGDEVLRSLGRTLRASTRRTDVAARIGGEEFAILLPDTVLRAALDVAEKLRRTVRSQPVTITGEEPVHCTVSLGVASRAADDADPSALLQRADEALYRAKRSGRDRALAEE